MNCAENQVVLGVDFGSTKIQVGAITPDGKALSARKFPTSRNSQEESISSLQGAIASFLEEWDGPSPAALAWLVTLTATMEYGSTL